MIGAWCFLDHYGPDDIKATGGMWVPPHPHTGLQTVTWLFEGLGRHTDSLGSDQLIRPGQLNVMTAGHGICHAEVSPDDAPRSSTASSCGSPCPTRSATTDAGGLHPPRRPAPLERRGRRGHGHGGRARRAHLAGTGVHPAGGRRDPARGRRRGRRSEPAGSSTACSPSGRRRGRRPRLTASGCPSSGTALHAPAGAGGGAAIALLLGGEPFDEEIVMWWNFIGRSHEEIVEQREAWNGSGLDDRAGPIRSGRRLRRRPAAGAAAAEHPAQAAPSHGLTGRPDSLRFRDTHGTSCGEHVAHATHVPHNGGVTRDARVTSHDNYTCSAVAHRTAADQRFEIAGEGVPRRRINRRTS